MVPRKDADGAKIMGRGHRMLKIVAGFGLLALGAVLVFLPGPGALTMGLGLALLAAEYVWAQRLLAQFKKQAQRVRGVLPFRVKT